MESNRREFLKIAGTAIAAGAAGTVFKGSAAEAGAGPGAGVKVAQDEMPKGMTFLTISDKGDYRLGVKTDKGVLDIAAASKLIEKKVPTTIDDLI